MDSYQEKISLLSDMIAFAVVDGELHDKEFDFLSLISEELNIEKEIFLSLFKQNIEIKVVKDEFQRILHFYRLALLMHCDGVLHKKENNTIHEMGIKMGLNPQGIKRVLQVMEASESKIINPEILICAFQEQYN